MFKQIWMLLALALVSVLALGACGGGDLAEDLTPIPTLPPGEEPTLLSPVAGSAPATTEGAALSEDELIALGGETFTANCAFCHGEQAGAAPAFPGMAARAAERVDGMSAEEYIHQSIVDPSAYVVEGYNAMPPVAGQLSDTEINALVAYIMNKSVEGGMASTAETPEPTTEPTSEPGPTEEPTPTSAPEETTPAATVDLELGKTLFEANCAMCHGESDGPGPAFTGMGERAAERVDGMSAEEYLHQSIVDPSAYVVEGFDDIMTKGFGDRFSKDELASIIGYILKESGSDATAESGSTDTGTQEVTGDPEAGQQVFQANCAGCHGESDGPGPAFTGMGERAAERVDGMSAEDYIHESIVDPSAYVVEGFDDIMPKDYSDRLSEDDIANLIAYILSQ